MDNEIYLLIQKLSKNLTEKRFYHSLGVQGTSFSLALHYNIDSRSANIAGLLHDCAKCLDDETMISECTKYGIPITEVERKKADLLHAKLGAYYAKTLYNISDIDIQSAITYHTTGKSNMTMLEKIVFVADYIEPNRSASHTPELEEIRYLAFVDLDKAIYRISKNTLSSLEEKGKEIDMLSFETYNFYKKKLI